MQLVFFVRDNTLLDSIFSLAQGDLRERVVMWHDQNLSDKVGTFPGILFFHYDDPEFNFSLFKEAVLEADLKENGFLVVLMSQELSVKEFKKLQIENKFIDGFLRMPIKLKDIETFVEDYKLVLNEVGESMEGAKKKNLEDPVNAKIQHRFDLVFSGPSPKKSANEKQSTVFNDGEDIQFDDVNQHGNSSMSENAKKNPGQEAPVLDFDMGGELEFDEVEKSQGHASPPAPSSAPSTTKLSVVPDNDSGLEFNLDFGDDSSEIPAAPVETAPVPVQDANKTTSGANFEFDFVEETADAPIEMFGKDEHPSPAALEESADDLNALFEADLETANAHIQELPEDGTQKTILFDPSQISDFDEKESFSLPEKTGSHSSSDLMTTDEARANIETTIKNIIRPKAMESTQEIDLSSMGNDELDFNDPTATPVNTMSQDSATGEFDLSSVEFADKDPEPMKAPVAASAPVHTSAPMSTHAPHSYEERVHTSFVSDEDSNRLQATIRQLREEREELLNQIKTFKGDARELEQDNLTLKAALDESKIEISILRKRHMVEMEDMKYRLSLNEEKKALAEERARAAEGKREKLEQRVRIDFNQVKQREKELETKLEMLTIDVDSQVQSRDQKILELRRKIDALEFNMENVSIKEQKSQDDKRKLEDKLNKIMKTLRHSIKNLEDDIDQATDDGQDDKESAEPRSKA